MTKRVSDCRMIWRDNNCGAQPGTIDFRRPVCSVGHCIDADCATPRPCAYRGRGNRCSNRAGSNRTAPHAHCGGGHEPIQCSCRRYCWCRKPGKREQSRKTEDQHGVPCSINLRHSTGLDCRPAGNHFSRVTCFCAVLPVAVFRRHNGEPPSSRTQGSPPAQRTLRYSGRHSGICRSFRHPCRIDAEPRG